MTILDFKREIWTCTANWTRVPQMVKRHASDLEVWGSNPNPGSNFLLKSKIVISQGTNYKFVSTYEFDIKRL